MANGNAFGQEDARSILSEELEPIKAALDTIAKNTSGSGGGSTAAGNPAAAGARNKPGSALSGSFTSILSKKGLKGLGASVGARGAIAGLGAGAAAGPIGVAAAAGAAVGEGLKKAVFEPATKVLKDTVFNGLRSAGQFGGEVNPFSGAFAKSLKNIPLIGEAATSRVIDPINRGGSRTAAITTLVARGGGSIDPAQRQALFDRFTAEERRAEAESFEVEKLAAREVGSAETRDAIFQELLRMGQNIVDSLNGFIKTGAGPRP